MFFIFSKVTDKLPKGKLAAKLGLHCHYVPPIEEAFNSLQHFLQEEFPKLIREINRSSLNSVAADSDLSPCSSSVDQKTCGSFSVLPVSFILFSNKINCNRYLMNFHYSLL